MNKFTITIIVALFFFLKPFPANAAIDTWQKGFNLRLNNQSVEKIDASLVQLRESGANSVSLSPGWITTSTTSSNVDRKSGTPTDELVMYTINKARSLGFRVMLKPHLDIANGAWRANLDPADKTAFFTNYSKMIMHYANIAQQTNTEQFSVGAELVKLTVNGTNKPAWQKLISDVRTVYTGKLTYSANADPYYSLNELQRLTFWDDLDYVGISFYRPMSDNKAPTLDALLLEWAEWEEKYILPAYNIIQKPFLFTEIGYRSVDGAAMRPWDYGLTGSVDTNEQVLLYKAFLEYWKDKSYIYGVNIWEWEPITSLNIDVNTNYTPQFKPAQEVVKTYFSLGNSVPPPPVAQTLITNLNRYSSGIITVGSLFYSDRSYVIKTIPDKLKNQEFVITKNADKLISLGEFLNFDVTENAYVYVAYDSRASSVPLWLSGFYKTTQQIKTSDATFNIYQKEYQQGKILLGGNMAKPARGAKSNYFVIVSKEVLEAAILSTAAETVTPPPDTTITPQPAMETDNSVNKILLVSPDTAEAISGEKKLKITLSGLTLDQYSASYSVDNQPAIDMPNDSTLTYKQAKIDFDTWDWNGSGLYTVTIVTKDLDGDTIDTLSFELIVED